MKKFKDWYRENQELLLGDKIMISILREPQCESQNKSVINANHITSCEFNAVNFAYMPDIFGELFVYGISTGYKKASGYIQYDQSYVVIVLSMEDNIEE